jgi:hypothetical protein
MPNKQRKKAEQKLFVGIGRRERVVQKDRGAIGNIESRSVV